MVDDNALGEQLAVDRILFYVMDRINDDFKPYNLIPAIIEHAKEFWPWVTDTTVVVPTDRAEVVYVYPPADFDAEELYQRVASDPGWRNNPNYRTELLRQARAWRGVIGLGKAQSCRDRSGVVRHGKVRRGVAGQGRKHAIDIACFLC